MAEQVRKTVPRSGGSQDTAEAVKPNPATTAKGEELKGKLDKALDEIDGVLNELGEEFAKKYVQRGGE